MLQLLLLLILLMLVVVVVIRSMAGDIYSVMSILHAAFLSSLLPGRFALAQMTTAWLTMCWPGTPVVISSLSDELPTDTSAEVSNIVVMLGIPTFVALE